MDKKIYYNLVAIATITVIITSILLVFLFYEYYNPKDILDTIDIEVYEWDAFPIEDNGSSYYDLEIDHKIVRVSKPIQNINHVFIGILPVMVGMLVFILIILYTVSSLLTAKIIKPIKIASHNIQSILTGENVENSIVYEELQPFVRTIEIQKKEIEHYIESLKKAEKVRREFTANISHELKTPLTSINGFAEMIEIGIAKDEDIKKSATIIRKEGLRLLGLIDSIIQLSQLDDISIKRDFIPIDIFSISQDICHSLQASLNKKDLSLNLTGESTFIRGNQRMLEDLISNLVDNAIKYNKPGGKVDVRITSDDKWGIFTVSDTGIGIPLEYQSRIFERFYRVDKSRSKKVDGTGLGLSIVKHIVEYHGGSISLSSIEGEGTTIDIKLPLSSPNA